HHDGGRGGRGLAASGLAADPGAHRRLGPPTVRGRLLRRAVHRAAGRVQRGAHEGHAASGHRGGRAGRAGDRVGRRAFRFRSALCPGSVTGIRVTAVTVTSHISESIAHAPHPVLSRRTLLGGAGLGLGGAFLAAGPASADVTTGRPNRTLRLATFNIHHGASPDDVLDLERTASVIRAMRVDVVGLQEVDRHWGERSDFVDQAAWLGRRLGFHHAYGANLDEDPPEPGRPRRQYGTAILSRWPILRARNTFLPRFEDHEQRGLLEALIRVRDRRIRFACTHLQHNDERERQAQAEAIVDLLGGADLQRTVLVGDLNAVPDTPEI